jgi:hypothetical protein
MITGYTIFTREQVSPKFKVVPGPRSTSVTMLNAGNKPFYPGGASLNYSPPDLNIYSDNPLKRRELLSDPNGTATIEQILAAFPLILEIKYNRLWQAAHDFEQRNISGVGLSILSLGVAQNKPKCLAVAAWSNRLWMDFYYPRKATISIDTEPDCDFSGAGEMPYSVTELAAEVYQ